MVESHISRKRAKYGALVSPLVGTDVLIVVGSESSIAPWSEQSYQHVVEQFLDLPWPEQVSRRVLLDVSRHVRLTLYDQRRLLAPHRGAHRSADVRCRELAPRSPVLSTLVED